MKFTRFALSPIMALGPRGVCISLARLSLARSRQAQLDRYNSKEKERNLQLLSI